MNSNSQSRNNVSKIFRIIVAIIGIGGLGFLFLPYVRGAELSAWGLSYSAMDIVKSSLGFGNSIMSYAIAISQDASTAFLIVTITIVVGNILMLLSSILSLVMLKNKVICIICALENALAAIAYMAIIFITIIGLSDRASASSVLTLFGSGSKGFIILNIILFIAMIVAFCLTDYGVNNKVAKREQRYNPNPYPDSNSYPNSNPVSDINNMGNMGYDPMLNTGDINNMGNMGYDPMLDIDNNNTVYPSNPYPTPQPMPSPMPTPDTIPHSYVGLGDKDDTVVMDGGYRPGSDFLNSETEVLSDTPKLTSGTIIGLAGEYKDAEIAMNNGDEIIIGRDVKAANIIINSLSISRKHCSIRFDGRKNCYYVTDYSSNGTLLDNGEELAKNQKIELAKGSVIYIGNRDNSFVLN